MTRGRAATPEPFDLGAVAGSDELFEALSTRRPADLSPGRIDDDPAASLLAALVADVDAGAPPLPVPARVTCGMPHARRRGVRVVVTFGVAALVLTSAGAAAAGGGNGVGAIRTTHGPARITGGERSNANVERHVPAVQPRPFVDRPAPRRQDGARHDMSVQSKPDPSRPADGRLDDRSDPWQRHRGSHAPSETGRPTPEPTPPPWAPLPTPTPTPTAEPIVP